MSKVRRSARRRKNPPRPYLRFTQAPRSASRKRTALKLRKRVSLYAKSSPYAGRFAPRFGVHRPKLQYGSLPGGRTGWKRPKHSKLFPKPVRLNPRHRRYTRRNPSLPLGIDKVAIGGLKMAGGIAIGMFGMPLIVKLVPASMLKHRKFFGAIHVVIGAVAAATLKNKHIKDAALVMAGTGVYDLIASNITMLGLPTLPNSSLLLGDVSEKIEAAGLKGDEPGVIGSSYQEVSADYEPALGSSYQEIGDDIEYGGDEIEIG